MVRRVMACRSPRTPPPPCPPTGRCRYTDRSDRCGMLAGMRHVLWSLTVASTAVPRFCQRWKAVGHLDRFRCTGPGAVGVGAGPVTADDLGAGMPAQPAREGGGVPAGQQIERPAGLAVDEDSAVVVPATGGEVIDTQHLWNGPERIRHGHDRPQQRCPAHPRLQDSCQTGPGPACESNYNDRQDRPVSVRSSCAHDSTEARSPGTKPCHRGFSQRCASHRSS